MNPEFMLFENTVKSIFDYTGASIFNVNISFKDLAQSIIADLISEKDLNVPHNQDFNVDLSIQIPIISLNRTGPPIQRIF